MDCPRGSGGEYQLTADRGLTIGKYAIDEMTPHFFLLTGQRHPIGCLSHLVSAHILQGIRLNKSYLEGSNLVARAAREQGIIAASGAPSAAAVEPVV